MIFDKLGIDMTIEIKSNIAASNNFYCALNRVFRSRPEMLK